MLKRSVMYIIGKCVLAVLTFDEHEHNVWCLLFSIAFQTFPLSSFLLILTFDRISLSITSMDRNIPKHYGLLVWSRRTSNPTLSAPAAQNCHFEVGHFASICGRLGDTFSHETETLFFATKNETSNCFPFPPGLPANPSITPHLGSNNIALCH